ncbi:MAG: hypothetical protein KGJ55_02455 [Gammaproteobacteria bacterium]|nr:hypothetical protein [Gammaproteobacteria bacterium]
MQRQMIDNGALEVCDLEYDVAGVGATETCSAQENQAAYFSAYFYRLPEPAL